MSGSACHCPSHLRQGVARKRYGGIPEVRSPRNTRKSRRTSPTKEVRPCASPGTLTNRSPLPYGKPKIGSPLADITRKLGISEATFYTWKKRFGSLGTPAIRELRQLRDENAKLEQVVADLTLDRAVLQDVLKKKW